MQNSIMENNFTNSVLTDEYVNHHVFEELDKYIAFYEMLSFSVFGFVTLGVSGRIHNIDSYSFSSTRATILSMKAVLLKGSIGDAYTLLRKYHDFVVMNTYTSLYLNDNRNTNNFIVEKIDKWVKDTEQLPEIKEMRMYIGRSTKLAKIKEILDRDTRYTELRNRCNNHVHYNRYYYVLVNDSEIYQADRAKELNQFSDDFRNIFIQHFAYLFSLNGHYMSSSDYMDAMDLGVEPEDGAQYYVAPFIQETFTEIIKKHRADLAEEIKNNTFMKLY